jgi:arylsulfatase A-like enzyme
MSSTPSDPVGQQSTGRARMSAKTAILLALVFGLSAGYLDLAIMIVKKCWWNSEGYYRNARDFPWTVPLGHVVLVLAAALLLVAVNWTRSRGIKGSTASWLLATLAIWGALLRMPLYAGCSLVLAAGLGRVASDAFVARGMRVRRLCGIALGLVAVLGMLAFFSTGLHFLRENRTLAGLSPAPLGARNVVLIIWDTVRAQNLSLYGYPRNTTPKLRDWARRGVTYDLALAPAPWTYPSHSSFFTGRWPYELNSQWKFHLDQASPTLAEHLASRGYQTAGFSANTNCCTYEGGLARGFAHFEDYVLTPRSLLSRTVPGKWILENVVDFINFYDRKWVSIQSRGARAINTAFLDWLSRRRSDRPFFAFLNYFDAHEPYIPPAKHFGRFGIAPKTWGEFQYLFGFVGVHKDPNRVRDVLMARDCYDDCIAYLDEQLGRLLEELRSRKLLDDTVVIIASDHGEGFGEHSTIGHSYTVYLEELRVPLVILAPGAPAGKVVKSPVSLRDLPATVADLIGLSAGSPFPGRSLAAYWKAASPKPALETAGPVFSERVGASALHALNARGLRNAEFQMSLVAGDQHFIRDGTGTEMLFNLTTDPFEELDLIKTPYGKEQAESFRQKLVDLLKDCPGSTEVERAYLDRFRQSLAVDVAKTSGARIADGS